MLLFIFEGLGTSELFLILIVALVLFGPRKLPQLSRSLGKSLANFKRASEDFKETWEKEVARESAFKEALIGEGMLPEDRSIMGEPRTRTQAVLDASEEAAKEAAATAQPSPAPAEDALPRAATTQVDTPQEINRTRKREWL